MPDPVRRRATTMVKTYNVMDKVMVLATEFSQCSVEFLGYLGELSDEDIKHTFNKLKEVITAERVFNPRSTTPQKYLLMSRFLFNDLRPMEKARFAELGMKYAGSRKKREKNGVCDENGEIAEIVRETVALDADGWKDFMEFEWLQSKSALPCPLCKEEERDYLYRDPMDFVDHVANHRCLNLYGCHHCSTLFYSVEAYQNHTCHGEPMAPRKKAKVDREFKSSAFLLVCSCCGYSTNVFNKTSEEEKQKKMTEIKALQLNHDCSNLMVVKLISTADSIHGTEKWNVEFPLRNRDIVSLPKECCGQRFEKLEKFRQHMFDHLTEKGKMATFLESAEIHAELKEYRQIASLISEKDNAKPTNPLPDVIREKLPLTADSITFDSAALTMDISKMTLTDLHICAGHVETEAECIINFDFTPIRPEELVSSSIVDRTFACSECSSICIGDSAATAHFMQCSPSENDLPEDFLDAHFSTAVSRFSLPNSSVLCAICDVVCCSLSGYQTHMAMHHNSDVKIVGWEKSRLNWVFRKEPSKVAMEINEFCGLSPEGQFVGSLENIYKPRMTFDFGKKRRMGRRADVFQQPPDLAAEENEKAPDVSLVPQGKKANCTVLLDDTVDISVAETIGSSVVETTNDTTMTEISGIGMGETMTEEEPMEEGEIREDEGTMEDAIDKEVTMNVLETAFSEDRTMTEESTDSTTEVEPSVAETVAEPQKNPNETAQLFGTVANDTMAMFATSAPSDSPAPVNMTMDIFSKDSNNGRPNTSDAESAMRVAQLWDEGRKSRETPPPLEIVEKVVFGNRCFDCGLQLKDEETLERHLKAHEKGSAPLAPCCYLCQEIKSFGSPDDFMQHLCHEHATKEEKNNVTAYQCKFCEREFPAHVLVAHLVFDCNHSPCGLCKEPLQNTIHIEREKHRKQHKAFKRFVCHCRLEFTNFVLFNNHVCAHDDKKLMPMENLSKELLIGIVPEHSSVKKYIEGTEAEKTTTSVVETIRASDTITIVEQRTQDLTLDDVTVAPTDILSLATRNIPNDLDSSLTPPPIPPDLDNRLENGASPSLSTISTDSLDSTIASTSRDVNRGGDNGVVPEASVAPEPQPEKKMEDEDDIEILEVSVAAEHSSACAGPSTSGISDTDIEVVERTASTNNLAWNALNDDGDIQMAEPPKGVKTVTKTREKKFKCNACSAAFLTKGNLDFHKEKHHAGDISEQDKLCDEDYGVPLRGVFMHLCMLCTAAFEDPARFMQHMRSHEIRKHQLVTCNQCSGLQLSQDNMRGHLTNHASNLLQYRCVQCNPNIVFQEDSGLMRHAKEVHGHPILYYCKNCYLASCDLQFIYPHVVNKKCQKAYGGIEGLGFALASQINYQPKDVAQYKAFVERNPSAVARASPCAHKNFIRFGQKFTSCPDKEHGAICMGILGHHHFENRIRSTLSSRDMHFDVDIPPEHMPRRVVANPGYNLLNYVMNRFHGATLFPLTTTEPPPTPPANQPGPSRNPPPPAARRPAGADVLPPPPPQPQNLQQAQVQATPQRQGVPIAGAPMSRQMHPGMQTPMHVYNPQQAAAMYGHPIQMQPMQQMQQQNLMQQGQMQQVPMQQMHQRPVQQVLPLPIVAQAQANGYPAPLMGCVVCGMEGAMPPMMMVTIPETQQARTKVFETLLKGCDGAIPDHMAVAISNRLKDPMARFCYRHVNPHSLRFPPGQQPPTIDVENVCFDYVDYTKEILRNPADYKNQLTLLTTHSRELHLRFSLPHAIDVLLSKNKCRFDTCGKALISNAVVGFHRAHTDRDLKHACAICKKVYESAETVFIHLIGAHHPNISVVRYELKCPLCEAGPINDSRLFLYHLKKNHGDVLKEPSIFCPSNNFATADAQRRHDTLHDQHEAYKKGECCVLCGHSNATEMSAYPALPNLSQLNHVMIHHSMMRIYSCRLCLDEWTTKKALYEHLIKKHGYGRTNTWQCKLCYERMDKHFEHAMEAHMVTQYRLALQDAHFLVVVVDQELLLSFLGLV